MRSRDIRASFRDFFEGEDHRSIASAPLVPHGDPTLMFTNAGMVQFKDVFLGTAPAPSARAVTVQKCLRVSGKHNDLENVGPSPRHHTFFEMLGNFSFGDYFKQEAIEFAWRLVTGVWQIPVERLFATVFEKDDEAEQLWQHISTLPAERILRCGAKDNFWAMGDTGPCGPCSEIFVDMDPSASPIGFIEGSDSGRYLEIWNLVFMQFDRTAGGDLTPLPNPSIDTGAGLERLAAVMQGVHSNYDTDLFTPILEATAALADTSYGDDSHADLSMRVVADHLRAIAFLISDGVVPASDGRGYVLRRLLRRAVRHGMSLGFDDPFLCRLLPVVGESYSQDYPQLRESEAAAVDTVRTEETKFLTTIAVGSGQVQQLIDGVKAEGGDILPGPDVFRLYDTFGLPLEVIAEIAQEEQIGLDEEGFEAELSSQRSRSRAAVSTSKNLRQAVREVLRGAGDLPPTAFAGYKNLDAEAAILALMVDDDGIRAVDSLEAGQRGVLIVDKTPFYAEAGGQIGDAGVIVGEGVRGRVTDTVRESGWRLHTVEVEEGSLAIEDTVRMQVDVARRRDTERNHTATHLLHAALRRVLGPSVRQAGSLVAPDRLRFDFTAPEALTEEQVREVEELVNRWVLTAGPTTIVDGRPLQEALDAGAMALFGEKYDDKVRTVQAPALALNGERVESLELCGGCHVDNVGEIGPFVIASEKGVASGVRRIEALTGLGALDWQRNLRQALEQASDQLGGVAADRIGLEIDKLQASRRELETELSQLRLKEMSGVAEDGVIQVDGVKVLVREVPPAEVGELRTLADVLRSRLGSGVVMLGTREEDKVSLLVAVTPDLQERVHAGGLARDVAQLVGGKGGGRADFAQAGGRQPENLPKALEAAAGLVEQQLAAAS